MKTLMRFVEYMDDRGLLSISPKQFDYEQAIASFERHDKLSDAGETINKVGEILSEPLSPEMQEMSDEAKGIVSDHFWELDSEIAQAEPKPPISTAKKLPIKVVVEPSEYMDGYNDCNKEWKDLIQGRIDEWEPIKNNPMYGDAIRKEAGSKVFELEQLLKAKK